jgi:hypothetical protein
LLVGPPDIPAAESTSVTGISEWWFITEFSSKSCTSSESTVIPSPLSIIFYQSSSSCGQTLCSFAAWFAIALAYLNRHELHQKEMSPYPAVHLLKLKRPSSCLPRWFLDPWLFLVRSVPISSWIQQKLRQQVFNLPLQVAQDKIPTLWQIRWVTPYVLLLVMKQSPKPALLLNSDDVFGLFTLSIMLGHVVRAHSLKCISILVDRSERTHKVEHAKLSEL